MKNIPSWLFEARNKWQFTGTKRPDFAEEPKKNQVSVWDFPRPPALVQVQEEVRVFAGETCIVKSKNALAVCETASPPTYYIPPEEVHLELLVPIPKKKSLCEWKGTAKYWALKTSPNKGIGWSYKNPFSPFEALKDYIAFYPQTLDCFIGDEKVRPQPGTFYAGWITDHLAGPFKGDPGTGHW
ncbi:DUF427 domain-containing protein [Croceitalea marina]|uniref:DUF427 domain-containing protein n=1 Tax=Croceitalea marina TaxID=1775166 RepID=A0ABW5MXP8_9FLAO